MAEKNKELTAEQRGAILYGYLRGDSYKKIAESVQCGKTTAFTVIKRYKETGSTTPQKRSGPEPIFNSRAQIALKKLVTDSAKRRRLSVRGIKNLWNKKKKPTCQQSRFDVPSKKLVCALVLPAPNH